MPSPSPISTISFKLFRRTVSLLLDPHLITLLHKICVHHPPLVIQPTYSHGASNWFPITIISTSLSSLPSKPQNRNFEQRSNICGIGDSKYWLVRQRRWILPCSAFPTMCHIFSPQKALRSEKPNYLWTKVESLVMRIRFVIAKTIRPTYLPRHSRFLMKILPNQ